MAMLKSTWERILDAEYPKHRISEFLEPQNPSSDEPYILSSDSERRAREDASKERKWFQMHQDLYWEHQAGNMFGSVE